MIIVQKKVIGLTFFACLASGAAALDDASKGNAEVQKEPRLGSEQGYRFLVSETAPGRNQRDNPERWLLDYASTGQDFAGGAKFLLNIGNLAVGMNVFVTSQQDVFRWHQSFGAVIRSNMQQMRFTLFDTLSQQSYTAQKSNDFNGRGSFGDEKGRYAWEGIISNDVAGSDPEGELTCRFGWGALDCTIRVFTAEWDSVYQVVMEQQSMFITKTPKTDLEDGPETADSGHLEPPTDPFETFPPINGGETASENGVVRSERHERIPGDEILDWSSRRRLQSTRGTDLIVFYTSAAASKFGSSSALESDIQLRIDQFNAALDTAGVSQDYKRLRLVSTWELSSTDSSGWTTWAETRVTETGLASFAQNSILRSRRTQVGADLMMLIHDWGSGDHGLGYRPGHASLVSVSHLVSLTALHEVGHNYGLPHCYGAVSVSVSGGSSTIMAYQTSATPRLNRWSSESATFWISEVGGTYSEISPWNTTFCTPPAPGKHCCTRLTGSNTLAGVHNYQISKGATRVAPATAGSIRNWSTNTCTSGYRGVGLDKYRNTATATDGYKLRLVCRDGGAVRELGSIESGEVLVQRQEPRSCPNGERVGGIGLYRYRYSTGNQDAYSLGVFCPSDGWLYTQSTGGDIIDYDLTAYWMTSQPDLTHITYVKFNRYQLLSGNYDTYNMDTAFAITGNPTTSGSLFQNMNDYRCLEYDLTTNLVIMAVCNGANWQQWYITSTEQIKSKQNSGLCLTYDYNLYSNGSVYVYACHGGNNQKWTYDGTTRRWRTRWDAKCLDYEPSNQRLAMGTCSTGTDQKFVFDTYTFSKLTAGPL